SGQDAARDVDSLVLQIVLDEIPLLEQVGPCDGGVG
ncbi:MAG: hypothetical protein QOH56_4358, partial [Pseudonocardiales bacterium]|nr:hypothetical protein [Pseudonocardiales bacterium]